MDVGATSSFGHHLRLAAFSSEIILHQAKVDIDELFLGRVAENGKLVRNMETGLGRSR
jgi:hypothetical protein